MSENLALCVGGPMHGQVVDLGPLGVFVATGPLEVRRGDDTDRDRFVFRAQQDVTVYVWHLRNGYLLAFPCTSEHGWQPPSTWQVREARDLAGDAARSVTWDMDWTPEITLTDGASGPDLAALVREDLRRTLEAVSRHLSTEGGR